MMLTTREKWLLTLLPSLAVLTLSGLFVLKPVGDRLRDLTEKRVKAEKASQGASALLAARQTDAEAKRDLAETKRVLTALEADVAAQRAAWSGSRAVGASTVVTQLLTRHGLVVIEEATVSPSEVRLPTKTRAVFDQLGADGTDRFRQLQFVGQYKDVLKAMTELSESQIACVPLRLSMDKANPDLRLRSWTLLLWI